MVKTRSCSCLVGKYCSWDAVGMFNCVCFYTHKTSTPRNARKAPSSMQLMWFLSNWLLKQNEMLFRKWVWSRVLCCRVVSLTGSWCPWLLWRPFGESPGWSSHSSLCKKNKNIGLTRWVESDDKLWCWLKKFEIKFEKLLLTWRSCLNSRSVCCFCQANITTLHNAHT